MFVEAPMQNIEYLKYPFKFENPEGGGGSGSENKTMRGITALAAFWVVIIYCNVPGMFGDVVTGLSRFAVPCFFMISGYYLFSKNGYLEKIPNKIWNTVKLILILKVMYLIIDFILLKNGTLGMNDVAYNFIISSDYNQHVWFLYALLALYVFSYLAAKHNFDISRLFGIAIVIIVIDLIFSELLPVCGFDTVQISNKIYPFIGLSFFIIGYLIHKNMKYVKSLLTNKLLAISVMGGGGCLSSNQFLSVELTYISE